MTNNPKIDGVSRCKTCRGSGCIDNLRSVGAPAAKCPDCTPAVDKTNELREHCKQCAEVVKTWPEWKRDCLGGSPTVERQELEFPAGAIHNGRAFIDQLESIYAFKEQQGHPLSLCSEWQELVRCFEWLAAHATDSQSTIARLEARIAELESGRGEPAAWMCFDGEGNYDFTDDPETAEAWRKSNGEQYADWLTPLFTAQPAPVAVVLPQKSVLQDLAYKRYGYRTNQLCMLNGSELEWVWQACLDTTAALNGPAK